MAVSIEAAPEPSAGRVQLAVAGGAPGQVVYVFRRDSGGVGVVRDTSAGTVQFPAAGPAVAVNLVPNADLDVLDFTGQIEGLIPGAASRVARDAAHPLPNAAGWSARITWGTSSTYPSGTRYPSLTDYPSGS